MIDEIAVPHTDLVPVFGYQAAKSLTTLIRRNLTEIERKSGQPVIEERAGPTQKLRCYMITKKQALIINSIRNDVPRVQRGRYGIINKARSIGYFYDKVAKEDHGTNIKTILDFQSAPKSLKQKFLDYGPIDCVINEDKGDLLLSHLAVKPVWDGNLHATIATRIVYGHTYKEVLQPKPAPGQLFTGSMKWPRQHYLLTEDQYLTMNAGRYKTTLAHKREVAKQIRRLFVEAQKLVDGETEEPCENQVPVKEEQKVSDSLYTRELIARIAGLTNSETATISGFLKDKLGIRIGAGPISAKDAFILLAASKKSLVQEWDVVEERAKQYESIGGEKGIEQKMTDLSPVLSLLKDEIKRTDMPYSRVKRYVAGAVEATGVSGNLVSVYTNAIIERL